MTEIPKLVRPGNLAEYLGRHKNGGRVVLAPGTFNPVREHHYKLLDTARDYGTLLVVAANSDSSVQSYRKSQGREDVIFPLHYRLSEIGKHPSVDVVTWFEEPDLSTFLEKNGAYIDVMVKGSDYTVDTINQEERRIAENMGIEIAFAPPGKKDARPLEYFFEEFEKTGGLSRW